MKHIKSLFTLVLLLSLLSLSACSSSEPESAELTPVTLILDWVPNVNHTGIFVAQAEGYFTDAGLDVEIIQPGEVYAEQAVASGSADFGISFQEYVTLSRADDVPIVSIAAIIQHNTSGFASLNPDFATPADFSGLRYGSFASPFEEATLSALAECAGGDPDTIEIVDTGFADPLALMTEGQIDFAWIFYGTQFYQAQDARLDLQVVMMNDYFDCIPDYYTPVFITSEDTISNRPEIVRAFLEAVSRGYTFAINDPDGAGEILLKEVPELDEEQVRGGQAWLADQYQADAPRWGEQQLSIWEGYSQWMADNSIIPEPIDADSAFTNEFLPSGE